MIQIRYTNGMTETMHTLEDAFGRVQEGYPDAVFFDASGWQVIVPDADNAVALQREGARILAWADEQASQNDDGAKAIASLRWQARP